MELLQLRYFKALAESQHLTNTAKQLKISPPSLSATIARFEKELGVTLFERIGRTMRLCKNGQTALKYVNDALYAIDNMVANLSDSNISKQKTISLDVSSPIIWHDAISSFIAKYPHIALTHTILQTGQLSDPSTINKFDFVITTSNDLVSEEWDSSTLIVDDTPCLAVPPFHKFAKMEQMRLIDAKDEPFIALSKGYSSRVYFDRLCSIAGFEPKIVLECDYALRSVLLSEQLGIVLSAKSVSKTKALGDAVFIDIIDPLHRRTQSIFWKKNCYLSESANIFRNFVIEYSSNI